MFASAVLSVTPRQAESSRPRNHGAENDGETERRVDGCGTGVGRSDGGVDSVASARTHAGHSRPAESAASGCRHRAHERLGSTAGHRGLVGRSNGW